MNGSTPFSSAIIWQMKINTPCHPLKSQLEVYFRVMTLRIKA